MLEITAVPPELEAVEVKDIGDDVVEEARVVGNDDRSTGGQAGKVFLQPGDVDDVQVISGFVEQEDVRLEQHGTGKGQLHLPTARKTSDTLSLALIVETNRGKGGDNFRLVSKDTLVAQDEVEDGSFSLGTVDVVLNVERSDNIGGWEALDLSVERLELMSGRKCPEMLTHC